MARRGLRKVARGVSRLGKRTGRVLLDRSPQGRAAQGALRALKQQDRRDAQRREMRGAVDRPPALRRTDARRPGAPGKLGGAMPIILGAGALALLASRRRGR